MFKYLFSLFFETKKQSSLPSDTTLAKRMTKQDGTYPGYFGSGFYHRWWGVECERECVYCVFACGLLSWGCLAVGAIALITTGSPWVLVAMLPFLINFGAPLVGTWWRRREIYRGYLKLLAENAREKWQQGLKMIREDIISAFDADIKSLESGFGPLKESEKNYLQQQAWVADLKNPVSNREECLARIDESLRRNRQLQEELIKKVGDKYVERELALCKLGEIEANVMTGNIDKNSVVSPPSSNQSQKVMVTINQLAFEAGTSAIVSPDVAVSAEDMAVKAIVEEEEKRRARSSAVKV